MILTMNIFKHKKVWISGAVQIHVDPNPTPTIKINLDTNPDKCHVKIKFLRNPTLEKSEIYELKIIIFDNGEPEEFLLFQ